jgi:hypothetical protein
MTFSFDLVLLPIVRQPEHDEGVVLGLISAQPPRRPARGRADDQLFLRLTLGGNAVLETQEQTQLLERAASTYYKTSGAVTGAIRKLAAFLNQEILNRNLHNAGRGFQTIGYLTAGVMRPDRIYLAQCGPTHAILASEQQAEHLHDPQLAGRGLGLARTTPVRYMQFELHPGDLILLSTQPSPAWTPEFLQKRRLVGLESVRRDLISQVEIDPFALLIQARPGTGKIRVARPKPVAVVQDQGALVAGEIEEPVQPGLEFPAGPVPGQETPPEQLAAAAFEPPEAAAQPAPAGEAPVSAEEEMAKTEAGNGPAAEILAASMVIAQPVQNAPAGQGASAPATPVAEFPGAPDAQPTAGEPPVDFEKQAGDTLPGDEPQAPKPESPRREFHPGPAFLAGVRAVDRSLSAFQAGIRQGLKRLLPDDAFMNFPTSVMVFIAVAIPLIVVAVAWAVYAQRGKASVYEDYVNQAVAIASQAEGETDADALRQIYSDALAALDTAEQERATEQSAALRTQIQDLYDQIEWIDRLDFQPALLGGLDSSVIISRIVQVDDDLFLLNAAVGGVIYAQATPTGYQVNSGFLCGPTPGNGPLVDIVALPRANQYDARILGIDANGNLIYCSPGAAPVSQRLPTPDSDWGRVEAIRLDLDTLYVLDPLTNAVWYYPGTNSTFTERPGFFFDENVPLLRDMIDMAVNRSDLYLLNVNSQVTTCVYSSLPTAPTRCQDPALFTDARPGRGIEPDVPGANFVQIQYSPPPEPSIFLLDGASRSVFHFSVQLTLQRQYQSRATLPEGDATAFLVSPNRRLFMALGSQLYFALIP